MDVVALVSVISSAVVGLGGVGAALWSASRPAAVAREQRKATAYQEILRYVHAKSRWLLTAQNNLEIRDFEGGLHMEWRRVPRPTDSEETTAEALLDAFASSEVRTKYEGWRRAANEAEYVIVMKLDYDDSDPSREAMTPLDSRSDAGAEIGAELLPEENSCREALADSVSADLGHRRPRRRLFARSPEIENPDDEGATG